MNVRDSVTETSLGGARGALHDGQYVDSLAPFARTGADISAVSQFHAAGERAGTSTVKVVRPGYRPFSRYGIVVTKDECHVHPQTVTAALAPAS